MKTIKPEDLNLDTRNIGESSKSCQPYQKGLTDDLSKNNCYTTPDCDTKNNCETSELVCDTEFACDTHRCQQTNACPTTKCGDTRTKAEICCALTDSPACMIETKQCPQTNPCLISRDIECETEGPFCQITGSECFENTQLCILSNECSPTEMCPATNLGGC